MEFLLTEWKMYVADKAQEIDPTNELDWYALAVGFAVGRGWSASSAHEFARHVRYNSNLG